MKNSWLKQIDIDKIKEFLQNYFKKQGNNKILDLSYKTNYFDEVFIDVETLDNINEFFITEFYLGEYFILNNKVNLDYINNNDILGGIENYQKLNKEWIKFIYNNTKSIKINNKTYKEFLNEKLENNLTSYYENDMAFVINNYLKNENGFTENATMATLKEFKKEYDKEIKNLPNVINNILFESEEFIK